MEILLEEEKYCDKSYCFEMWIEDGLRWSYKTTKGWSGLLFGVAQGGEGFAHGLLLVLELAPLYLSRWIPLLQDSKQCESLLRDA